MTSRLLRGAAALALAAPLTIAAVAGPAAAAGPVLVDRGWPGPPAGAGQLATLPTRTTLDTAVATDTEAAGPITVTSSVTGVGDAGGDGGTLTAAPGVVTDLHHPIAVTDEETGERTALRNLVGVSSDIISGDSGGALLDADGDVVGMNVAASSGTATLDPGPVA